MNCHLLHFQQKRLLQLSAIVLIALVGLWGKPAVGQQSTNPAGNQGRQLSLREQLVVGLKAFTKSDFVFIDRVVLQVRRGKLPERMVNGTFLWSREKAALRSPARELRPMVYFRPALTLQAKRIGVNLSGIPVVNN